jgi:hypothetical protein
MCCRNGRERHTATAAAITPGEQLPEFCFIRGFGSRHYLVG